MNTSNLIGYEYVVSSATPFHALNPHTNEPLKGDFHPAQSDQIDQAAIKAATAFMVYRKTTPDHRANFLRDIGKEALELGVDLIDRACAETGLSADRIQSELIRTVNQLNMFADLITNGSWVEAAITAALPNRKPFPGSDIRKMLIPIGPVVVFGASNFPLAFSVAGGDTASALAAGCPVIVKAHAAHPGTSALMAGAIYKAAHKNSMPDGVFSLLFDDEHEVGQQLVKHPKISAVTFTGSFRGGMALIKLVSQRDVPIPIFTEMGSINPVVILPEALEERSETIANQLVSSISLGAGQFCTNPGLFIVLEHKNLSEFKAKLANAVTKVPSSTMLTSYISKQFQENVTNILRQPSLKLLSQSKDINTGKNIASTTIAEVSAQTFLSNKELHHEVFGPLSLLVVAKDVAEISAILDAIGGQLTITFMANPSELSDYHLLLDIATKHTGRLLLNNVPTGVEVCAAMQHGGPFPASNDSRYTAVGTMSIKRFVRPLSFQNWPDFLLPDELKNENPMKITRITDYQMEN